MREKIKQFIKNDKKTLYFSNNFKTNIFYNWTKIIFPLKLFYNFFIIFISKYLPMKFKIHFLRFFLKMKIKKNVGIAPFCLFDYFYPQLITIKDNVIIGLNVNILTHEFTHKKIKFAKTIIEENALIGAFTNIRCGVRIGKNSIVAMNSFVNKDIPDNEMWGGIPAKFIKKIK